MGLVDEETGDAPVGQGCQPLGIGLAVLDAGQFRGGAELAPADAGVAGIDEGGMGAPLLDAPELTGAMHFRAGLVGALSVERHAPAAAPDAVVAFDQRGEIRPGGGIERSSGEHIILAAAGPMP
jgi:hypothetical protein